jgi:competence protein ComEA
VEPSSAPWRVLDSAGPTPSPDPEPGSRGRPWLAIGAALLAVAVAAGAVLIAARPAPSIGIEGSAVADGRIAAQAGTRSAIPSPRSAVLVVEVGGAVARPGVYRLPAGSRVGDAIEAAGGFGPRVDARAADRSLNLAAPLTDGEKVHVPDRDEAPSPAGASAAVASHAAGGAAGAPVDLNRATAAELDALPGIGPATAAKIIAAREAQPFASVDDLATRKVVGAATLAKIRALVTVGG